MFLILPRYLAVSEKTHDDKAQIIIYDLMTDTPKKRKVLTRKESEIAQFITRVSEDIHLFDSRKPRSFDQRVRFRRVFSRFKVLGRSGNCARLDTFPLDLGEKQAADVD